MLKKMTYSFNTYDVKDVLLSIAAVVLLVKEALLVGSVELKAYHNAPIIVDCHCAPLTYR